MGGRAIDLTKQRFGRLVAIEPTENRGADRSIIWRCQCDCGAKCFVSSSHLQSGHTQSCSCLRREKIKASRIKHGLRGVPEYASWQQMLQRCENPNNYGYKYYGARGIKVCERWHNLRDFIKDLGRRPKGLTLERMNNNGDYEPGNVRWATQLEQMNNTRRLKSFIAYGPCGQFVVAKNQHSFARKWELGHKNISACLLRKRKQHKGWAFEYLYINNSFT